MSTEWRSARVAILMATLERHRKNIMKLEERKAMYGLDVPLALENELEDERRMAKEVEAQLQHIIAGGEEPLDRLFREATRARLTGQIGRALHLYKQIWRESEGGYPDIEVHIMNTEQELKRDYVGNGGTVIPDLVRPSAPVPTPRWKTIGTVVALLLAVSAALFHSFTMMRTGGISTPTSTSATISAGTRKPTLTRTPRPATPTLTRTPRPATPTLTRTPRPATPTIEPMPTTSPRACFDTRFQRIEDSGGLQEVRGYVYDMDEQPLRYAVVEVYVKGYWSQFNRQTFTTDDGGFVFENLGGGPDNEYIVRVIGMPGGTPAYNTREEPYTFKFNTGHDRAVVFIYQIPFSADLCHPPAEVQ